MATRRTLGGRYELGGVLGRGGMATVHRGTDTTLGRTVAIKILAERYAGDERFVERFRREAQASARLNHPNIVSVYDTGDEDGIHYIVMELVEGETLADMLHREGRLSTERSARIAVDVARALDAAHAQGIVHRDVKPGNVMLTAAGEVMVGESDAPGRTPPALGSRFSDPGSASFANPKSSTLTVPSGRTLMFAGFRSRWMMPCACAASSASAICRAMGSASSIGIGPCAIRSASVSPSTSSMTRAEVPSASST